MIINKVFEKIIPFFTGLAFIELGLDLAMYVDSPLLSIMLRTFQLLTYIFLFYYAKMEEITTRNRKQILYILTFIYISIFSMFNLITRYSYTYYWFSGLTEYIIILAFLVKIGSSNAKSKIKNWFEHYGEALFVPLMFICVYIGLMILLDRKVYFNMILYFVYSFLVLFYMIVYLLSYIKDVTVMKQRLKHHIYKLWR